MSEYAKLQARGLCGHCARRPRRGVKTCDICIAKATRRRETGGSIAGWRRVLERQAIRRMAATLTPPPKRQLVLALPKAAPKRTIRAKPRAVPVSQVTARNPRTIRTDDPHFMSPAWFVSLTFDLGKIDKRHPSLWFLRHMYWRVRKDLLRGRWLEPLALDATFTDVRAGAHVTARRINAEYERRLAEVGIEIGDGREEDDFEYGRWLPRQPTSDENRDRVIHDYIETRRAA